MTLFDCIVQITFWDKVMSCPNHSLALCLIHEYTIGIAMAYRSIPYRCEMVSKFFCENRTPFCECFNVFRNPYHLEFTVINIYSS